MRLVYWLCWIDPAQRLLCQQRIKKKISLVLWLNSQGNYGIVLLNTEKKTFVYYNAVNINRFETIN